MNKALNSVAQAFALHRTKEIKKNHSKMTKALPSELKTLDQSLSSISTSNIFDVKKWYDTAEKKAQDFLDHIQDIKFVLVPAKLSRFQKFIRLFKISLKHSIQRVETQEKIAETKLAQIKKEHELVKEKIAVVEKKAATVANITNCIEALKDLADFQKINATAQLKAKEIAALGDQIAAKETELEAEEVIFANFQAGVMNAENDINTIQEQMKGATAEENAKLAQQLKGHQDLKTQNQQSSDQQLEKIQQLEKALEEAKAQLADQMKMLPDEIEMDNQIADCKTELQNLGLEEKDWDLVALQKKLELAQAELKMAYAG